MYTRSLYLLTAFSFSFSFDIGSYWPSHQHWDSDHNHPDPSAAGASQKYTCVDILRVHVNHGSVVNIPIYSLFSFIIYSLYYLSDIFSTLII